jgi:hypothetical protein
MVENESGCRFPGKFQNLKEAIQCKFFHLKIRRKNGIFICSEIEIHEK